MIPDDSRRMLLHQGAVAWHRVVMACLDGHWYRLQPAGATGILAGRLVFSLGDREISMPGWSETKSGGARPVAN